MLVVGARTNRLFVLRNLLFVLLYRKYAISRMSNAPSSIFTEAFSTFAVRHSDEQRRGAPSKQRGDPTATNTTDSPTVVDYPYWGSPKACSLADLVKVFSKKETILLDTPNYIALNKPADLRMDGDFPANVHKLLWYWYPTPTLRSLLSDDDGDKAAFFARLEQLPKNNMLEDSPFRSCHRLDYATSGVLLMARNKEAVVRAHRVFQDRQATKIYLAVVHGYLDPLSFPQLNMTFGELKQAMVDLELQQTRDNVRKRKPGTFAGYQAPNDMFQKWKGNRKRKLRKGPDMQTHRKFCYEVEQRLITSIDEKLSEEEQSTIRRSTWPDIEKKYPLWRMMFKAASDDYNNLVRERLNEDKDQSSKFDFARLPRLFRLDGSSDDTFFVNAGVAKQEDSFAMKIQGEEDDPKDFQLSVTKCTVLERRRWQKSRPQHHDHHDNDNLLAKITRVRLEPLTGRRHQLRCHMAVAGSPIVGDATYEQQGSSPSLFNFCARMCLHAHRLVLPGLVDVTAPDPFGELLGGGYTRLEMAQWRDT